MIETDLEQRVVILLSVLDEAVAQSVLEQLSPQRRQALQDRLAQLAESPPPDEEVDEVVDEFERFFRFASQSTGSMLQIFAEPEDTQSTTDQPTATGETEAAFEATDDPLADLNRLDPLRIAGALREEAPRTIALILTSLSSENAGATLQQLPEEIRGDVFLQLNNPPTASRMLLERLVRATVQKAVALDLEELTADNTESDRKIADMLRSMERNDRQAMLAALEQHDPDTATRVNELLYLFEDLLIIEDRSMQKLLAEVDSGTLATSLKDADDSLQEKVMSNLSRRARESLAEEIEFLGHVAPDALEAARKAVLEVVARLDQAGDLIMTN